MSKTNLIHARTCVYNVNYHIVWSVKYRRKVLNSTIEQRLKEILLDVASEKGFTIVEMEVGEMDHIHLFVTSHPKLSISYIVKMMKGISGRLLMREFPSLSEKLWKGELWNPSYYVETIGSVSEENIKRYIQNQEKGEQYMRLVHSFNYKPNNYESLILGYLTYASARLFNVGLYERYEYKKLGFESMPNWYEQKRNLKNNMWFKSLPSQTSQDVLQRVDEGFKSYFKLLKTKGIDNPDGPHYKKKGSHFNIKYLNNSFKIIDNEIRLMIPKGLINHLIDVKVNNNFTN